MEERRWIGFTLNWICVWSPFGCAVGLKQDGLCPESGTGKPLVGCWLSEKSLSLRKIPKGIKEGKLGDVMILSKSAEEPSIAHCMCHERTWKIRRTSFFVCKEWNNLLAVFPVRFQWISVLVLGMYDIALCLRVDRAHISQLWLGFSAAHTELLYTYVLYEEEFSNLIP